jgi:mRNA-decapping enzyme subunit 2
MNKNQQPTANSALSFHHILDELVTRFILNVPEEEFESFDRLFFQIEEAHWFYDDYYREHNKTLPSLSFKQFVDRVFEHCSILAPYREAIEKHTQSFYQYKSKVPVYGAILLNQSRDKVLLVKGWNAKAWSFPRGKINQGEQESACAVREVKEEIGFDIAAYLNPKNYIQLNFNEQTVKLYIVTDIPENVHFAPKTRKEIRSIEWHPIDQIVQTKRSAGNNNYVFVSTFITKLVKWLSANKENRNEKKKQSVNNSNNSNTATKSSENNNKMKKRRNSNEVNQHKRKKQPVANAESIVTPAVQPPPAVTLLARSAPQQPQMNVPFYVPQYHYQPQPAVYTPSIDLYAMIHHNNGAHHQPYGRTPTELWMASTTVTV